MGFQVFRYNPSDEHGEHAVGTVAYPRGPISDEWLEDTARALEQTENPKTVDELCAEIVTFKRADGKPLYTQTSKARRDLGEVTPLEQPKLSIQDAELKRLAAAREEAAEEAATPAAEAKAAPTTAQAQKAAQTEPTEQPGPTEAARAAASTTTSRPS